MFANAPNSAQLVQNTQSSLQKLINTTFNWRTLLVFVVALLAAWLLSRLCSAILLRLARAIGRYGDAARTPERAIQFRRLETYLSIAIAMMRAAIFAAALFVAWSATHEHSTSSSSAAIIGASTIFIVVAGATIAPMLRDFTAGSLMIAERWYNVGEFVTIDPYLEESGVVERMNLRSTRIRKINGEILWIHNQYITRVSVSPNGVRTMAIDLFVNDLDKGMEIVEHLRSILTVGPIMLAKPLEIAYTQKLGEDLWEITLIGQTAPGREWLLEKFAVSLMKEHDEKVNGQAKALAYEPLVRYADPVAENRFKRAMRIRSDEAKASGSMALIAAGAQSRYRRARHAAKDGKRKK